MAPDTTIPDLRGKRTLVTGASDGIGFVIASRLAEAGAEVVMPVRSAATYLRDAAAWASAWIHSKQALGDTLNLYDVSALRADADLMVWWHAPTVEALQAAYARLRRSAVGAVLEPVWSSTGLHRPAEFNRGHVPAFMAGEEPRAGLDQVLSRRRSLRARSARGASHLIGS